MKPGSIITLTTDFGQDDAYVAAMKGVILSINHRAAIVDLSHEVAPQDVRGGAFLLHLAAPYFPSGTIHLAVVDPGVGTERKALLVKTERFYFLAPDNGLLSFVLAGIPFRAFQLANPRYWRQPVSATFHGRDIFAPVAAHLSLGVSPEEVGTPLDDIISLPFPRPRQLPGGGLRGEVLYIDRFGNLITNIRAEELPPGQVVVSIKRRRIKGLSRSYAEGRGTLALIGSSGYLEIAVRDGLAALELGAGWGTAVRVAPSSSPRG